MGHNLEKNLRKVQGLRSRGQLDKALKQLQDWARKYPDTPHYLYEAAMGLKSERKFQDRPRCRGSATGPRESS